MGTSKKRSGGGPPAPTTTRRGSGGVDQPYGNAAMLEQLDGLMPGVLPTLGGVADLGSQILDAFGFGPSLSTAAPDAASDLELAKSQLGGRFTVLSPSEAKKKKDRAPNEITQEEFDRVARQFSDIRRGKSDLRFGDYQDEAFKNGAMDDIASILQTENGRKLISGLTNNVDEKTGTTHHLTELRRSRPQDKNVQRTTPLDPFGPENAVRNFGAAPIPGTDMKVEYIPGQRTEGNGKVETGAPWMPIRSDVTLFHELTHALHGTHGRQNLGHEDEERETVGFNNYDLAPNSPLRGINENAYREERAEIGEGTVGVRTGDEGMLRRRGYTDLGEKPKIGKPR